MRDPVNDLYDAACDVLVAAHRLRDAAARHGAAREGLPASLGCLTATLDALTAVCDELAVDAAEPERVADVGQTLAAARRRCEDARVSEALLARRTRGPRNPGVRAWH